MRVQYLQVEHAVDSHLDVVFGDANLLGDIHGIFFEPMAISDALGEWQQQVEAGV